MEGPSLRGCLGFRGFGHGRGASGRANLMDVAALALAEPKTFADKVVIISSWTAPQAGAIVRAHQRKLRGACPAVYPRRRSI